MTGSMANTRYIHTASVLLNGTVLVAAGSNNVYLASAELYDPSTGVWSVTRNMINARRFHTESVLLNGTVLAAGGEGQGGYLTSAELY